MSGYRGGHQGGGGRGGGSHTYMTTQKGRFEDGVWKCDCNPRQPASHLQVRKPNENQGKWFYGCQKRSGDPTRCKFFLWETEARPREATTVLSNSRSEPAPMPVVPTTPRKPPAPTATCSRPTPRMFNPSDYGITERDYGNGKHGRSDGDEDDDYGWDNSLDSQELARLEKPFDMPADAPETPRKAAKTDVFTTPGTSKRKLPWLDNSTERLVPPAHGLLTPISNTKPQVDRMTPQTNSRGRATSPSSIASNSSYATAASERQKEILRGYTLPARDTTPTPSRSRDIDVGDGESCLLITDVFEVLGANHVMMDDDAKQGVRRVLNKFDLRMQGIIKGREISRLAMKAKDAKITELQLRISTLEAELETEKALVQHFKWKAENDQNSD